MRIAIIPGHGGSDSGAVNEYYGEKEKDYNWKEAEALLDKFDKSGHQVRICREKEEPAGATEMQKRAIDFKAEVCLCLHHNASSGTARGWKVFYHSELSKPLAEQACHGFGNYLSIDSNGTGIAKADSNSYPRVLFCLRLLTMPSILLESCFIDNNEDCRWLKAGGWEQVVDALYDSVTGSWGGVDSMDAHRLTITPHDLLEIYVDFRQQGKIELPGLMGVTYSQWMLESGWCSSELAQKAYNFGGLKDRPEMDMGGKYFYKGEYYERFDQPEDYIKGYWQFLDRPPYRKFNQNKSSYASNPEAFIACIGPIYCPTNGYVEKVLGIYGSHRFRTYRDRLEVGE